jgi:chlorobactene glucosyltransferase
MIVLLWALVAIWGVGLLFAILNASLLPRLPPERVGEDLPSLTVVIPARDEEVGIEAAVLSHCTQEYPGLQVVVVDDGSSDRTPEILAELSARCSNLEVLRCDGPPPGWLGKPNALQRGLERAGGDYVLFADADVRYAPGAHARAMDLTARAGLDMLVLLPHQTGRGGALLMVSLLDAILLYGVPSFLYNVPSFKRLALGCGAGNLVRRAAFEAAGGFGALRGEVVEDIAMGLAMKAFAGRYRAVLARDAVAVQMYPDLRGALEGFSKNLYAFVGFNPLRAAIGTLSGWLIHLLPPAVLLAAPWVPASFLLPAAVAAGLELILDAAMCLWAGYPLWVAPLYPVRAVLWNVAMALSAWRYRTRGVVWRGRTYRP